MNPTPYIEGTSKEHWLRINQGQWQRLDSVLEGFGYWTYEEIINPLDYSGYDEPKFRYGWTGHTQNLAEVNVDRMWNSTSSLRDNPKIWEKISSERFNPLINWITENNASN